MLRIVRHVRPRFVIIENVANLRRRGLAEVIHDLACIGYVGHYLTVAAAHIGAPHLRERILIVAYPNELLERLLCTTPWPEQIRSEIEAIANADNVGAWRKREEEEQERAELENNAESTYQRRRGSQSADTPLDDGVPDWLDGVYYAGWWARNSAPPKCGIPRRTRSRRYDELECIGNAVVPGIAAIALQRVLYLNSLIV
jgi:DNA (cytosine-5)-methyltransferase 1